jgi:hypothetical protein
MLARLIAIACVLLCSSLAQAQSRPEIQRAQWGAPGGGNNVPVAVARLYDLCRNGFPCDVFANTATFGDPKGGTTKQLTIIWHCHAGQIARAIIINEDARGRIGCPDAPPSVVRRIGIVDAVWQGGGSKNVKSDVEAICGPRAVRCDVPPMEYILGDPSPGHRKRLSIRYNCNGQGTLGAGPVEEFGDPLALRCDE